jgi:hypothetical protein
MGEQMLELVQLVAGEVQGEFCDEAIRLLSRATRG